METKTAKVKRLVAEGEYKQALQICKDWTYDNPEHRNKLRLGYECLMYPGFYQQLGHDPTAAYNDAVKLLQQLYR